MSGRDGGASPVVAVRPLGFPWETADPFLFCAYHDDAYPAGTEAMAPRASLQGRRLGEDFSRLDGWSMYHGRTVPGFPSHPHRGFETVTIVRRGLVDHSDSLGATARYGQGDVQWLTAGAGVVHAEMFPLVERDAGNPLELFQIWLNLPAASKMAPPHFTMFWADDVPRTLLRDEAGRVTQVMQIAGGFEVADALPPPPQSWAARPEADVAIWTIRLDAEARFTLPPARGGVTTRRTLYFFAGDSAQVGGEAVVVQRAIELRGDAACEIVNGAAAGEFLLLQGRPIGEPVAQYGPFVMNTQAEIVQAFDDYRRTQFGGWPWSDDAPVHPREQPRFARRSDGRVESPSR